MTIRFKCQHCGKDLSVAKGMSDKAVRCECGKWVVAREEHGRISRAVSHALHPIKFSKSVLRRGRKEAGEAAETPEEEGPAQAAEESEKEPAKAGPLDKSLVLIAPPKGEKDQDWGGLISKHLMSGQVDELTAYAYTRQAKEIYDTQRHGETVDLFETARDCYGQYCQVLVEKAATADGPDKVERSEAVLADLEKCMYNFAVLICNTRVPEVREARGGKGKAKLLLEELALAAKILSRPKGFWNCGVVFTRNKEQLVGAISECFERYGLKLSDHLGESTQPPAPR